MHTYTFVYEMKAVESEGSSEDREGTRKQSGGKYKLSPMMYTMKTFVMD